MKLRQKIILTHVLTIALILTGVVFYGNTVLRPRLLQDKTAEYDAYINQLCTSASLVLSNMEQNCFNLYQNVLLAEGLESHASPSKKRIQVEQELRNMCGNNSYFTSFLAVDLEGNTFFGTSAITDRATPLLSAYYSLQDALENSYNYWFRGDNEEQLYLKMPVCYITPLKFTGMLIAQTSSQQMMSALGMDRAMSGKTCILTRAGASLLETSPFSTEEQQAVAEYASQTARPLSREVRIDGVSYWITVHTDTRYGWRAAHLIPLSDALNLANAVCSSGALLCLAVAALAIGLAALIAHSLTRSVQKLQLAMNEVSKGDFDVQVDINTRDEIGELAEKFSWMQKNLKESTDQMIRHAVEHQKAEYALLDFKYRSLQSKISPHFICNILASISALAQMGRQKEVSTLAVRASQYLRDNLSAEEQRFTSLRTELRYVEEYVYLYREIYGDENTLVTDIPAKTLNCRVPGMLLQPLVENALVHSGDLATRTIHLTARRQGDWLALRVSDNGGSFSEQTIREVEEINEDLIPVEKLKGFGLRSVLQRLRLLYRDHQSLTIFCDPGVESRIEIRIPWECYHIDDEALKRKEP